MRPSTEELLRGIKKNFDEVILPEVTSPWPRSVAHTISYLLAHAIVRVGLESRFAVEEARELVEVLQAIVGALAALPPPDRQSGSTAIADEATRLLGEAGPRSDPAEVGAWNLEARELLVRLTLAGGEEAAVFGPAQGRVDAYLRSQLERDLALTEPIRTRPFPPRGVVME